MKKLLALGLLALPAALITDQQASAWTNTKFAVGLTWSRQSGGNNFLWGLFRNGQPPCCPDGGYGGYGGYPYGGPAGPVDYYGYQKNGATPPNGTPTQAAPAHPAGQQTADSGQGWYGNAGYQQVNYSYNATNPYNYYPQTYYGYQVPSYWYGR